MKMGELFVKFKTLAFLLFKYAPIFYLWVVGVSALFGVNLWKGDSDDLIAMRILGVFFWSCLWVVNDVYKEFFGYW